MIRSLTGSLKSYLRMAAAYIRLNLNAQLEYRGAFLSQVIAMTVNDAVWVAFWIIFFARFPVLRGWTAKDVITVWALACSGFGLAAGILGNSRNLARLVVQGQLDVWMLYPRSLLPHVLLGSMSATAWGDAIFGYGVYVILVRPSPLQMLLFLALTLSAALLFVGFGILSGSLAFFVGNSESLSQQWQGAMISFSTYPSVLFDGWVKVLLYTLVPAAFVTYLPIAALRDLSLVDAGLALAGSLAVLMGGVLVFHCGLQRYESGNLMEMRG